MSLSARILLVEDDDALRTLVGTRLSEEGYSVDAVNNGELAVQHALMNKPDLVILDIMLPGLDGLEVCRRLRARYPLVYILLLTARTSETDRIVGLEVGADDYVTKPFSLSELVARIRAALRRLRTTQEPSSQDVEATLFAGELQIDPIRREVRRRGELLHLTVREFDLLLHLARHPDRPFTRLQLLEQVWNISYEGYDRTVDSHVQRLRAKIEDDSSNPTYIRTVWGVGYKFQFPTE